MPGLENIIYDESTETMYVVSSINPVLNRINRLTIFRHIAGFRAAALLDPKEKFTDMTFVEWGLAIPPSNAGWEKDSTKWAW